MKKIIFSAYFCFRPERLTFMQAVREHLPTKIRMVLFNQADILDSDLEVINAADGLRPQIAEPMEALSEWLTAHFPDRRETLLEHARGELEEERPGFENRVANFVTKLNAFERALDDVAPDHVFLWNQFNVFHRIAAAMADARGIEQGYFHDGLLPGSIAFDFDGEMGNSWIARNPERLAGVAVTNEDLARAEVFLESLTTNEINRRHTQSEDVIVEEALRLAGLHKRPLIFLAGQNDWQAGLLPHTDETRVHSPLYNDSISGLRAFDQMAAELGFSLLYKPHPLCRERTLFLQAHDFPNSLILKSTSIPACLDASRVVSTIASQISYVAILAGKPVLMLGRNQITGKGLTYDAERPEDLPALIEQSIRDPLAATRRQDLIRHVAQLERCYLVDYGTMDNGFYRRGAASIARALEARLEHDAEEVIALQIAGVLT